MTISLCVWNTFVRDLGHSSLLPSETCAVPMALLVHVNAMMTPLEYCEFCYDILVVVTIKSLCLMFTASCLMLLQWNQDPEEAASQKHHRTGGGLWGSSKTENISFLLYTCSQSATFCVCVSYSLVRFVCEPWLHLTYVVLEYCIGALQEMLDKSPANKFPVWQAHKSVYLKQTMHLMGMYTIAHILCIYICSQASHS